MWRGRVVERLAADFLFGHVQRTFDGGAAALDGKGANLTLFAAHPLQ